MNDFLFAINIVLPIIIIIGLGYFVKRIKLINKDVFNGLNKLCFKIFLPISLLKNIYDAKEFNNFNIKFILFISISLIVIFLIGLLIVIFCFKDKQQKGVILQALFRSNYAIIGIPLAQAIAGVEGAQVASLIALITIPFFNIFATIALSIFVEEKTEKNKIGKIILKIILNPLIIGVVIGILCLGIRALLIQNNIDFRISNIIFIDKTISSLSVIASPLALFTLGGLFEFSKAKEVKNSLIITLIIRLLFIPIIAFSIVYLCFDFNAAEYAVLIAVFVSPVAVSSAIMAKEMKNDHDLANQIVVWTTIISSVTIFIFIYVLRLLNIF